MGHNPRDVGPASVEWRRLVDGGATAKERLLLQAGIDEVPPNRAGRQRALAALGLAVGTSAVAGSAKAAMGLPKGVALLQAKWLVFGALSTAAAVGTVEVWTHRDTATAPATASATLGRKATTPARDSSPTESAAPLTRAPSRMLVPRSAAASLESAARAPAALPPSPAAEMVTSPSELVAQVAALDRARAALRAGSARQSVALLDRFDRSYPRSSLAPEATVVRVSALLALGQRARATDLVRAYCRSGGRGAYGHRLMALVGLSETACEGSSPSR
jgi:hypothetical protein